MLNGYMAGDLIFDVPYSLQKFRISKSEIHTSLLNLVISMYFLES